MGRGVRLKEEKAEPSLGTDHRAVRQEAGREGAGVASWALGRLPAPPRRDSLTYTRGKMGMGLTGAAIPRADVKTYLADIRV